MKEHPIIIVVTLAAMAVGAILGAAAFFAFFDYTEKWGNLNIEKKD